MARVHRVAKARKDQGKCQACGKTILIGDAYKWAKPRYRGRVVVCDKCQISQSMLSSSKMVACWDAQTAIEKADDSDLAGELRTAAETTREVGEEYQDSADRQREYFPDAEQAEENEERAEALDRWASQLEEAADDVEGAIEAKDALTAEQDELETERNDLEGEEGDDMIRSNRLKEIADRLVDIEREIEEQDSVVEDARTVADECPD